MNLILSEIYPNQKFKSTYVRHESLEQGNAPCGAVLSKDIL